MLMSTVGAKDMITGMVSDMSEIVRLDVERKCHTCGVDIIDSLPILSTVVVAVLGYDAAIEQPSTPSKLYLECMDCHNKRGD